MNRSAFEEEVLGFVCDDYEAPHTIASDMARELRRPITEAEVREALLSLACKGQVFTFKVDRAASRLIPIDVEDAAIEPEPWFLAKPEFGGREDKAI